MNATPLPQPVLVGHDIYRGSSYGSWHPLRVPRVSTVMDLSAALGWLPPAQFRRSPRARPAALAAYHTPDYIAALAEAERSQSVTPVDRDRYGIGTASNPIFAQMFRRPATSAGGAILGAELIRGGGRVYVPGGGMHHGLPARANGFCFFNDPALALIALQNQGLRRIAYVDIDAHHPDGVEHGFARDRGVLQISIHEENRWPRRGALADAGAGQVFNLPVPLGFNDTEMAAVRDRLIVPAIDTFAPDAIVLQCGADAVLEDPQSRLALSNNAHWDVLRALMARTGRLLVLGGGGYNPWSVGRLWTGVWGILNGHDIPEILGPEAQDVLAALTWDRRGRPLTAAPHWITTLRDTPRPGPLRPEIADRLDHLSRRIGDLAD